MRTKLFVYMSIFFLLILINILVVAKIRNNIQKNYYASKILSEIDHPTSDQFNYSSAPFATGTVATNVQLTDGRVANLKSFFRKYNSPLYPFASLIVDISDQYRFDYRLLPAIAMQESNLCRVIPDDSHNCWGWGIYGDTVTKFDSYEEAIQTVASGIKQNYLDKGLVTTSAIMAKYTPSSSGSWAHGVNTFLRMLE